VDEPLREYRSKRDLSRTLEPDDDGSSPPPFFVVQEHYASRLHHDLRLLMDGTLKSWAVPKGMPETPKVKRLAVQTEDHPISYGSFEGTIPEGHYGAGTVTILDRGDLDVKERGEDKIVFEIKGAKLNGTYALIRFKGNEKGDNWLLMRTR
jgi:bifunctional non-homologous end joining protein LigD